MRHWVFAGLALLATSSVALAREGEDEIIVTAMRYVDRFEETALPAVTLTRRADAVILDVTIESDSRDAAQRRTELQQTLTEIERRARVGGPVSVGLLREGPQGEAGETSFAAFTLEDAMATLHNGARPDTTRARMVLRTPVGANDTLKDCIKRLSGFLANVPKPGRVLTMEGQPNLSLVNPGQYRAAVIAAIIADGRTALALAGPGHGLQISGLERRIAWRRADDLNLTLFVPHSWLIAPARP